MQLNFRRCCQKRKFTRNSTLRLLYAVSLATEAANARVRRSLSTTLGGPLVRLPLLPVTDRGAAALYLERAMVLSSGMSSPLSEESCRRLSGNGTLRNPKQCVRRACVSCLLRRGRSRQESLIIKGDNRSLQSLQTCLGSIIQSVQLLYSIRIVSDWGSATMGPVN